MSVSEGRCGPLILLALPPHALKPIVFLLLLAMMTVTGHRLLVLSQYKLLTLNTE